MAGKDVHILLVEDNEIDARIVQRMFQKHKIDNPLYVARDGIETLDILRGHNSHTPISRPFLIVLDLNMPRMNGLTFLHTLCQDPELHDSIVFILTTSDDDRDKVDAYQQHIARYLLKSQVGSDFLHVLQMVDQFILTVQFPPELMFNHSLFQPDSEKIELKRT